MGQDAQAHPVVLLLAVGRRPFVPGVHGLQHVHHFGAAHLAHHHAVGPHAQAVADQVAG
ncbi:Uncharacterised protein [Bordetella pertussis]|nr:Uncharacterised protein [Bordetella pertussis]